MKLHITHTKTEPALHPFEIVERKGLGHPDTLADLLAEHLSRTYSAYTKQRFGSILRHQFDKITLMCGRSKVSFGGGELVAPIRVLLNGRASARLGDQKLPIREILITATHEFFAERFPMLDPKKDLRILFQVRYGLHSTTGGILGSKIANQAAVHYRFHPRTLADLPETNIVQSNDTSLGCAFAPFSPLETLVLTIETALNGLSATGMWPWLGSDVKIMAVRRKTVLSLVVAAPVLSSLTQTSGDYFDRVKLIGERVRAMVKKVTPEFYLANLVINSGDDLAARKLYMSFTGSSIESGDEGQVGRGNRLGGLIAPARPFTMEGICGKNPVYHVGKLYSVAAFEIAKRLYVDHGISSNVFLINRMAESLKTPWHAHVELSNNSVDRITVESVAQQIFGNLEGITDGILRNEYRLV